MAIKTSSQFRKDVDFSAVLWLSGVVTNLFFWFNIYRTTVNIWLIALFKIEVPTKMQCFYNHELVAMFLYYAMNVNNDNTNVMRLDGVVIWIYHFSRNTNLSYVVWKRKIIKMSKIVLVFCVVLCFWRRTKTNKNKALNTESI